jgi:hypothetical protein
MCEDFAFSKLLLLFSISSDWRGGVGTRKWNDKRSSKTTNQENEMTNEKNPIHTKSLSLSLEYT